MSSSFLIIGRGVSGTDKHLVLMETLAQESPFMSVIDLSHANLEHLYHTHRRTRVILSGHLMQYSVPDEWSRIAGSYTDLQRAVIDTLVS